MFPPFSETKAKNLLEKVLNLLDQKKLFLSQVTRLSEERKNSPVMIGALVCKDKNGNEINFVANSGISKQLTFSENGNVETADFGLDSNSSEDSFVIVPPIVSAEKVTEALAKNDAEIHSLTELRNELKKEISDEKRKAENKISENGQTLLSEENELNKREIFQKKRIEEINEKLRRLCGESFEKFESLYDFACADGKVRNLKNICKARLNGKFPPTGTGDCTAPKLLHYAFARGFTPVSLAETVFQKSEGQNSGKTEKGREIELVLPCDTRCGIILPEILGLEILYRDDEIVVVNKQSGLLSVPGRGPEKIDSVETRLRRLFPDCIKQPAVHRLDMETSGLMILALTKDSHRKMNQEFEGRNVKKEYTALLDGILAEKKFQNERIQKEGEMELYFRLDIENRPHQIWDRENGKKAVTQWKILDVERYHAPDGTTRNATRVLFIPHTGRTHQLRLASADIHGFGTPIIGDTLYGHCADGERLLLHASKIEFTHPKTGKKMILESKAPF